MEVKATASPLLPDLRSMTLSNLVFPMEQRRDIPVTVSVMFPPNLICRLAVIMSPIAVY